MAKGDTRCVEGRLYRHDPQDDDPYLETERGPCPVCNGKGCEKLAAEAHTENDYDTAPTDPAHGGKIWKPTK